MINRQKVKYFLEDEGITIGKNSDDLPFVIFSEWSQLDRLNQIAQHIPTHETRICYNCGEFIDTPDCKSRGHASPYRTPNHLLEIGELLAYVLYLSDDEAIPFPVTESDILRAKFEEEYWNLIRNGQLAFLDNPVDFTFNPLTRNALLEICDMWKSGDDINVDDINWGIKNTLDSEVEWGFDDEWDLCGTCSTVIHRDDISIGLKELTNEIICPDCMTEDDFELIVGSMFDRITANESPIPVPYVLEKFLTHASWVKVNDTYQNGLHRGMRDNPTKQFRELYKLYSWDDDTYPLDFAVTIDPSQFYVEWEIFVRINPYWEGDDNIDLTYLCDKVIPELLAHTGKDRFSPGDMYAEALKHVPAYTNLTINCDTNTGDIRYIDNMTGEIVEERKIK